MKFAFKLLSAITIGFCLVFPGNSHGRPIIVLTYNHHYKTAKRLYQILEQEMGFPKVLLTLKRQKLPCKKIANAIAHICVEDSGNITAPQMRYDIIKRNFHTFYMPPS